jgi:hypothetical protein
VEAAGMVKAELPTSGDPEAPLPLVSDAMAHIPNAGSEVHYDDWIRLGYACYRTTGGSDDGYEAWETWSKLSDKFNQQETEAAWARIGKAIRGSCAPKTVGAGTIFFLAAQAGWNRPIKTDAKADTPEALCFFDPWDEPPPPQFPRGVLLGEMEDAIFMAANRDGVCPGALAMAYLAAVSGAANKSARFVPYANSSWSVPPIIWVMTIADSGQRKTAIEDMAFAGLRKAHAKVMRDHSQRLKQWQRLSKQEQRDTPKPEEPHSLIVEDVTPEKLQTILAANDRGTFMLRDEMAGLLEFGRYTQGKGASERAFYLQAYEGGHYTVSRLNRDSIHIEVNAVALYGSIQPDRLADFPDLAKDGLLQRINMIRASRTGASRDDVVVQGLETISREIDELTRIGWHQYDTTTQGSALIRETEHFGRNLATIPDLGQGFQGTCSKLHGTHARYALLLHLLEAPQAKTIATDTVERAGRLVRDFLLLHARDFFSGLRGSPSQRLRDVASWVLTKAPMRFRAADVTANVRACRALGTRDLADALDPFVTGGWLEPESPYPSNRAWKIHPQLRTQLAERAATEVRRRAQIRTFWRELGEKSDKFDGKWGVA